MKKLAGLLAFAVALGGAIILTQYYSMRYAPAPPPPSAPAPPATGSGAATLPPPASAYTDARGNAPVSFKLHFATLDTAAGNANLALTLEHDPARPAPADVWVWAYFFSPDAPGRYCEVEPFKLRQPFGSVDSHKNIDNINISLPVSGCPAPRGPSSTYYARVNVSTESAFAARLTEQRISYDVSQASPVVLKGKQK
ncbi:MAG TPA: hypothetical protein VF591_24300 [Pyrinomonadaceae bacterium]|jgi:hypothetical protein